MKAVNTLKTTAIAAMALMLIVSSAQAKELIPSEVEGRGYPKLSRRVKVAILDSGSNIPYEKGISLIDGTVKDYNGHGTLMTGIVKEVCPRAELYIIKVMGKDGLAVNEEAIILGIEWAISRKVDVINMSLRLKGSERLHQVIKEAYSQGIAIVAAAGNKFSRMGILNTRYAIRDTQYEIAYPARYSEVIAVGALNKYGKVYHASAGGEEVELLCKGYRGRKAGTSIASAYAAGLAAKIILESSDNNTYTIRNVRQSLPYWVMRGRTKGGERQ